jgi:hypothetical protein
MSRPTIALSAGVATCAVYNAPEKYELGQQYNIEMGCDQGFPDDTGCASMLYVSAGELLGVPDGQCGKELDKTTGKPFFIWQVRIHMLGAGARSGGAMWRTAHILSVATSTLLYNTLN